MTQWIYKGNTGEVLDDRHQFVSSDGTRYPWNFPKDEIPGMQRIFETPRPNVALNHEIDNAIAMVNSVPTRVWTATPYTQTEIDAQVAAAAQKAADAIVQAAKDAIQIQILTVEATVTNRRLREAILGKDAGWLAAKDAEIAALRLKP